MPRKLIPLTDDITNSESFMKLKTWQKNENYPAPSTGECERKTSGEKVKAMVSKWNRTKEGKVDDEKLDIFSTAKKAPKDFATNKLNEKPEKKVDCVEPGSSKGPKLCKTVEEQKQLATEREKKAMENCQSWKGLRSDKDVANYDEGKNLSLQSLNAKSKPRAASRSVSFLLPNLPTAKLLQLTQPDTDIVVNEAKQSTSNPKCNEFNFDPREKQQEIDGNRIKVYRCGGELFAKLDGSCENENDEAMKGIMQKNCNRHINLKSSKLCVFEPRRQQKSVMEMTLGKPYGIQLGSLHIGDDYFPEDLRNKQALDVLLVTHGMTYIKSPVHWTQHDIDKILIVGTELCKETNEIEIDKLSQITKGFTYKNQFIQVTMSEPIVVGKIMTMNNRSIDLQMGLKKFFSQNQHGILITPEIEVYIMQKKANYVFDPRGRTMDCERSSQGEAGLMAFASLSNVYHLLVNLSCLSVKSPFKICAVTVTQITDSNNVVEKFTAASGNPNKKCRNDDYKHIGRQVAYLQGSVHLGSKVFGNFGNKQHLTTSIMAMVYSKIDPPNSWSSTILDRVLHFGAKLYANCIEDGPIRNLTLTEIPSKFYVGDVYRIGITIAPFFNRVNIEKTRLFCDNAITKVLRNILETSTFRCLLLQIDNYTYAVWQMMNTAVFYFFDGYQKDVNGKLDTYEGNSCLFMTDSIDKLCEIVVNRVVMTPRSANSILNIHGMKILEVVKLSKRDQKCKPKLKMIKMDCIKPMTSDEAEKFEDSPSTVDSVAPVLTEKEILKLREKPLEKPIHRKITDLNSASLVCCKVKLYDDIMSSVDEKLSFIERKDCSRDTFEAIRIVQSEMMQNAVNGKLTEDNVDEGKDSGGKRKECSPCEKDCGNFVACAEKVLLKTDLDCLEQKRDELLRNVGKPNDDFPELISAKDEEPHFEKLPDGSEIVRGTKKMFELPLEQKIYTFDNLSIVIGISAIITSTKYSIGSWTPETVDYVIGCGHIMSGIVQLKNRMDFYTYEQHNLPKIHLKNKFYNLKMITVQNGMWCNLENILKKIFSTLDRFIIITTRGSFAVFARKDFYYIYEYSTCNMVGFRIKNNGFGSTCFLRFPDIHLLVRRIYANHPELHDQQKFLISQVVAERVRDSNDVNEYVPFTASQEKEIVEQLRQNQMMRRDQMVEKMKQINAKICAEKERIKKYRDETGKTVLENVNVENLPPDNIETSAVFNEDDFKLDAKSLKQNIPELKVSAPLHEQYQVDEVVGFQECDDGTFKIQGSFALCDKSTRAELKACHFSGVFAIMYAVHHPVESMNYRSVDVILENGKRIMNRISIDEYEKTNTLKGIVVDTTSYELMTVDFEPKKLKGKSFATDEEVKQGLKQFFTHQKYCLITSRDCCCVVVIRECDCFHLFDPYVENSGKNSKNAAAAWYKIENLDSVFYYLQKWACPERKDMSDLRVQFVKVLSYKTIKLPKAGYFLLNLPSNPSPSNQKSCQAVEQAEDEKIEWIYSTETIPWSRMEMKNAMNVERYLTASKWKEFDVEMDNKLYSLWGNIHPNMKIFKVYAGKQHLACAVISLVMSHMYNIDEWDAILLDSVVAHGHKYYLESIHKLQQQNYQLKVEDLRPNCSINNFVFDVNIQPIIYGKLYDEDRHNFNLNRALNYVFCNKIFPGVILQCGGKFLAVGNVNNRDYFMFDSQAHGPPLFSPNQGTSYVLKCCCLKVLLACICLTLDIKRHNVKFYLYAVNTKIAEKSTRENYEKEIASMQSMAKMASESVVQTGSGSSVKTASAAVVQAASVATIQSVSSATVKASSTAMPTVASKKSSTVLPPTVSNTALPKTQSPSKVQTASPSTQSAATSQTASATSKSKTVMFSDHSIKSTENPDSKS